MYACIHIHIYIYIYVLPGGRKSAIVTITPTTERWLSAVATFTLWESQTDYIFGW